MEAKRIKAGKSTKGGYWKPVCKIQDTRQGEFDFLVANSAHIRNIRGGRTDQNDAMWVADLMARGMIRSDFIPGERLEALRTLISARKKQAQHQMQHAVRSHETLKQGNVSLVLVTSDIMDDSGRWILEAIISQMKHPEDPAI